MGKQGIAKITDTHGHWSEGITPEMGLDETGRYFNGEVWPRTQKAYRYSFKTWGDKNRAGTKVDQIFTDSPAQHQKPANGAAPDYNLAGTSGDQHKYKWGSTATGSWQGQTNGAQIDLGNRRDKFANMKN